MPAKATAQSYGANQLTGIQAMQGQSAAAVEAANYNHFFATDLACSIAEISHAPSSRNLHIIPLPHQPDTEWIGLGEN